MLREYHRIALSGKTMFDSTAGRYFLVAHAQTVKQKSMGGAFVALCTVDTIRDDYTQFNVLEVLRDDGGMAWKTLKSPSTRLNGAWVELLPTNALKEPRTVILGQSRSLNVLREIMV